MNRRSLRLKFISGAFLALVVLAAAALWKKARCASSVMGPKDQELIATFYARHLAFEQLQEMAAKDARRGWYLG